MKIETRRRCALLAALKIKDLFLDEMLLDKGLKGVSRHDLLPRPKKRTRSASGQIKRPFTRSATATKDKVAGKSIQANNPSSHVNEEFSSIAEDATSENTTTEEDEEPTEAEEEEVEVDVADPEPEATPSETEVHSKMLAGRDDDPTMIYMVCEECGRLLFEYEEKNKICECNPGAVFGCFWQEIREEGEKVDTFACYRVNDSTTWGRARTRPGPKSEVEMVVSFPEGGCMNFSPRKRPYA